MATLELNASAMSPAGAGKLDTPSGCSAGSQTSSIFGLVAAPPVMTVGEVKSGSEPVSSGSFARLSCLSAFTSVTALMLAIEEGDTMVSLLVGRPPEVSGAAGTFPTGFSGGETFAFQTSTHTVIGGTTVATVSVTFDAADQTAAQVAARINAAAVVAGVGLVATVVGGQLVLTGVTPGATSGLNITTANATIGFASTGLVLGFGSPIAVSSVAVLTPGHPGDEIWVSGGPATLHYLAAAD